MIVEITGPCVMVSVNIAIKRRLSIQLPAGYCCSVTFDKLHAPVWCASVTKQYNLVLSEGQ